MSNQQQQELCTRRPGEIVAYMDVHVKRAGTDEWICVAKNVHNVFTNAGRDYAHAQTYTNTGAGGRGSGFIAVSAETTAPVAGDTTLAGEISSGGLARADATTKNHSNGTNATTIEHTFTASAGHTDVHKAALFTASSVGTMTHAAVLPSDVTLAINDQLKITFNLTLG